MHKYTTQIFGSTHGFKDLFPTHIAPNIGGQQMLGFGTNLPFFTGILHPERLAVCSEDEGSCTHAVY